MLDGQEQSVKKVGKPCLYEYALYSFFFFDSMFYLIRLQNCTGVRVQKIKYLSVLNVAYMFCFRNGWFLQIIKASFALQEASYLVSLDD